MMLQADERDPANSLLDYGYEDDPDDLDKFSVSFEGLMAFLDGDKDENPDEKNFENTNGFCQYSDNVNGENSAYIHSALLKPSEPGLQWTSADYSQTYDSHGTGLGTLFAHETSENFSQPNTPEKFYTVHNASEKNFLKDDSCDLSEYYGQQSYGHETNHSFLYNSGAEIDRGKCCAALCEIGTDHMGEYSSCTNQELSGFFNTSTSPEVYTFDVQDNFNGCGSQENSAYKGNFFTSRGPLVDPDSVSSSVPNIVIDNIQTFDIKVESTKNYLTSKYSGGSRTGSLMETTSFLSLSDAMGENTGFSRSGRADQHCTSFALPNQITSLPVKQEKAVESSFQISSVDVDVSSPSSNYHHKSSVDMPFAESFSVPLTGSGDTVMNYQDFKNILQSINSKTSLKDEFHVSLHSSSQERCSSASEVVQCNSSQVGQSISDDADICVLEDISAPTVLSGPARVFHPRSHSFPKSDYHYSEEVPFWHKVGDERLTFQMALQDLSEPKSEASPPSGVLAVPLLRHQRIALSWMMQKETSGLNCSGGILADDQGLGKTISTIALILSERASLSNNCNDLVKPIEIETLNLEDDEEEVQFDGTNHHENSSINTKKMRKVAESGKDTASVKGRPSAGTLVVCPTSVLRQWAEELRSKVTSKGNLSFLVYHGSNRTKDPVELSKYDVVLTTYSIVTMEVPKQLGSDKDEEKVKSEVNGALPSSRKRKTPSSKSKGMADRTLIEAAARPLARVAWFRVILDEAQTIKNHRTQVAKACCGLRAKRRWCLSGTPIQNAIDDLYSYFRFLRYEPYALYNSFCSTIKIPINKNPTTGYKKLQAVLKTVMLRRTKGSLLDGQPIISLPPKSVTLKKVDFSAAERSFYQRLEAESCEQFKVYAAEGTVKQNYVNILLMLLRLRQACDHPLLVQEYDSGSPWKASMESAKKLPWGKQVELLNHLEASMAICTICSDPPEDAVVAICSHVFCNQCVCEHLMGDDKHCPAFNCKTKLDASLIFPKSSLSHSLSALEENNAPTNLSNESVTNELFKDLISSDSSKIKAAIEILQALPELKDTQTLSSPDGKDELNGFSPTEIANEMLPVSYDGMDSSQEKCSADVRTEKAIVFSQWTRMLDLLETRLKSSSIEYRRLDGTMSVAARDKAVKDFNTIPQVTVMIMSLKAASLGLNLVAACHVLLLDLWWNPTTEDQAIDRAHRIGQTRPVTVARLTVNNTVEDRILLLQEKKRKMVSSAFGEDETGSRQSRLTVDDLKYLFMFNS